MLLSGPSYRTPALGSDRERRVHVRFRVSYPTKWGQNLVVTGSGALLGNMHYERGVQMRCHHNKDVLEWEVLVQLPWAPQYTYRYAVVSHKDGQLVVEREESQPRVLDLPHGMAPGDVVEVDDTWVDASYPGSILATCAFTKVIRQHRPATAGSQPSRLAPAVTEAIVRFKVSDWMLEENQVVCVTGAIPQLGMWQQDQMLELTETETPSWEGEIRVPYSAFAFTYKYAVVTKGPKATSTSGGGSTSPPAAAGNISSSSGGGVARQPVVAAAAVAAPPAVLTGPLGVADGQLAAGEAAAGGGGGTSAYAMIQAAAAAAAAAAAENHLDVSATAASLGLNQQLLQGGGGLPLHVPPMNGIGGSTCTAGGAPGFLAGAAPVPTAAVAGEPLLQPGVHPLVPPSAVYTSMLLEVGEPHVCSLPPATGSTAIGAPCLVVRSDGFVRRDKLWRGAGVALPVFSLRSRSSVGVGEFLDLLHLVDLADACGMRLIQVLPINDTCVYGTWWDSYPYSTVSVHALHPQYLALRATVEDLGGQLPADIAQEIEAARQELAGPAVKYEETMAAKMRIARQIFDRVGHKSLDTPGYKEWYEGAKVWLQPYAAFMFLKGLFGSAEHWTWGAMATPTPALIQRLTAPDQEWHGSIQFCCWLQYQLHHQLKQVSEYAAAHRVVLKGDLPIGVDKRSVDTWMEPKLFRMDKSTGAPPDMFDPKGQNWGFPTYNWQEMSKDGYAWWKRRLGHMAQYFHAYRIDHILGFCRIWEVPGDCATGLMGYFRPSHPLTLEELGEHGVKDVERLTQPYIRQAQLESAFGGNMELAAEAAAKYLVEYEPGRWRFREQWNSEKAIASIAVRPSSPQWLEEEVAATKAGLLALRQNVVLLRDPDHPNKLYPRFGLMNTSSYRDLDAKQRAGLAQLHDDYFYTRHDQLWRDHALATLPALMSASDMLICGEDLGFVPACLPPVMQELGLIGLRIQRMPTQPGVEFNNPASYPYLTVASPSCHDITPLRAWWEEDAERRERFYYTTLGGGGPPPDSCTPDVASLIIQQHLNSPSAWVVLPIQDIFALLPRYSARPAREEIINDPTVAKHYWRYRMHVDLEELVGDEELLSLMQDLLLLGDRAKPSDLPALDLEEAGL